MIISEKLLDDLMAVDDLHHTKLLDYFAIAAPPVPKWFKPSIRQIPRQPPSPDWTHEERDFMKKYYNFDTELWENREEYKSIDFTVTPIAKHIGRLMKAHQNASFKYDQDLAVWTKEHNEQTLTQWPYYYAHLMLQQRCVITTEALVFDESNPTPSQHTLFLGGSIISPSEPE